MCFSAEASFTASAVLAIIGILLIIRNWGSRVILLSLIPSIFALQQFSEGFVWLALPEQTMARFAFLFFAYIIWPIWIPLAVWYVERKKIYLFLLSLGIATGLFLIFLIPFTYATPYCGKINYFTTNYLFNTNMLMQTLMALLYAAPTLLPFFLSSIKKLWVFGVLAALSGIATYIFDRFIFVSVWCFFSAILSISLFFILKRPTSRSQDQHP